MSKIKTADFYYGAVLSMLFNNKVVPALVEGGDDRQVYGFTTDRTENILFVKYRSKKGDTKKKNYSSWQFNMTANDLKEIKGYIDGGSNILLTLVCGSKKLSNSEIAVLDKEEILELMRLGKKSINISRIKGEHSFRVSIGGSREDAMKIKCNRFEELF